MIPVNPEWKRAPIPKRLADQYAGATVKLERYERDLRLAFARWDRMRRTVRRFEKRLDQLTMGDAS